MAFATALAFGEPPGRYHFAQDKMHHHLWSCFERRQISMFPYSKLIWATESTVKSVDEVPVYCICRMPELPNTSWIKCSGCKRWYHTDSCINVPRTALSSNTTWYCNRCSVFLMCNSAQLVYVYSCLYVYFIMVMLTLYRNILKLLTNLFAITIPYLIREDQNFQDRTNCTRKYGPGDYFFPAKILVPGPIFPGPKFQ